MALLTSTPSSSCFSSTSRSSSRKAASSSVPAWPAAALLVLPPRWASSSATPGRAEGPGRADRVVLAVSRATAALAVVAFCLCGPRALHRGAAAELRGRAPSTTRAACASPTAESRASEFVSEAFGRDGGLRKSPRRALQAADLRASPTPPTGWKSAADLTFEGGETHLPRALERARQELSAVPLSGLVLVTDGADNGRSAEISDVILSLEARAPSPSSPSASERKRFDKDVELVRVDLPSAVLEGHVPDRGGAGGPARPGRLESPAAWSRIPAASLQSQEIPPSRRRRVGGPPASTSPPPKPGPAPAVPHRRPARRAHVAEQPAAT